MVEDLEGVCVEPSQQGRQEDGPAVDVDMMVEHTVAVDPPAHTGASEEPKAA